ncbi:MAG TPA: BON domain-containing protein [Nevskiaceae bacterium]|nr:BON domain-containing protein [Nevskiaceae bacterium]
MNAIPFPARTAQPAPAVAYPSADDPALRDDVVMALGREIGRASTALSVSVDQGVATLNGIVEWPYQVGAAEHCVRDVPGIRQVVNRLRDRRTSLCDRIRVAIHAALGAAGGDHTWIEVHVQPDGTAILYGMVRDAKAREVAEAAALQVTGNFRVEDRLCVMHG